MALRCIAAYEFLTADERISPSGYRREGGSKATAVPAGLPIQRRPRCDPSRYMRWEVVYQEINNICGISYRTQVTYVATKSATQSLFRTGVRGHTRDMLPSLRYFDVFA